MGIAVGVVLGLGALISLLIFCFRRKRKQAAAERLEDEKSFVGVGPVSGISRSASTRSTKTGSTAPRLNLRPVTQFSPNLDAQNANAIAMTPINEKTEKRLAEDEERRLELAEEKRQQQIEQERAAEIKNEEKNSKSK